jgi:thiol-disulfide isomerase/thioredoxin
MRNIILILIAVFLFSCSNNKRPDQKISRWELAPDIYILDKNKPVETFSELTGFFKGKALFIDRWASWCSPCIEEFNYIDSLHQFLNNNKIEMLYLNSDQEIQDSAFYQFIISHKLSGNHLRLNDSLKKDLIRKQIFIPRIPQYLIINQNGIVVENNALRPSNGQKLYDQIKSKINK